MRRRLLLVLCTAVYAAGPVCAQSLQLRAVSWWPSGGDLAQGFGLAAEAPLAGRFVLEGRWQRGSTIRTDVMCSGLVPPGSDCSPQPTRLTAQVSTLAVGYRLLFPDTSSVTLALVPAAGVTWAHAYRIGQTRPASFTDDGGALTAQLLLEGQHQLFASSPLRLSVAAGGALHWAPHARCYDCREVSFQRGFRSFAVEVGLALPLH